MVPFVQRVRVTERPGFGRVLQATEPVRCGEDVLVEPPIIVYGHARPEKNSPENGDSGRNQVLREYGLLSGKQRAFLESLDSAQALEAEHTLYPDLPDEVQHFQRALCVNAFVWGNAKDTASTETLPRAIFETATRFEHSCRPNADVRPDPSNGVLRVSALYDIEERDFVRISYLNEPTWQNLFWPRWKRQEVLRKQFGFECLCERCEEEREVADGRDGTIKGSAERPSAKSLVLAKKISTLFDEGEEDCCQEIAIPIQRFLARSREVLGAVCCPTVTAADDGPMHRYDLFRELCGMHVRLVFEGDQPVVNLMKVIQWTCELYVLAEEETARQKRANGSVGRDSVVDLYAPHLDQLFRCAGEVLEGGEGARVGRKIYSAFKRVWADVGEELCRLKYGVVSPMYVEKRARFGTGAGAEYGDFVFCTDHAANAGSVGLGGGAASSPPVRRAGAALTVQDIVVALGRLKFNPCRSCGDPARQQCLRCRGVWYCDRECQKADWKQHKLDCVGAVKGG